MVIAHNLLAMNAQRQYGLVTTSKAKTTEKLASGYKINRAADDAAGLTISEKMRSQIRGLNQGSDNIQDGISLVQIADGALAEVNDMLHRMTELSIKSANGTNTDEDRSAIQKEINRIIQEIDRISESTEYNTMPLFKDKPDPLTGYDGRVTKLVSCSAYESSGGLSDAYKVGSTYYPSATLDFSKITENNIEKLYDKEFSFVCGWGCQETFVFKFTNGGGDFATGLSQKKHTYNVDVSSLSSGTQIVDNLMKLVGNNQPTYNGQARGPEGVSASHSNMITTKGDGKLVVYSMDSFSNEKNAKGVYPKGSKGSIDCSSMENLFVPDPINGFNIQCSNNKDDSIYIETKHMNTEILNINRISVITADSAKSAIAKIEKAGATVSEMRSSLGAYQNRLEHAYDNNNNKVENTTAAESRIRDTDMAAEMVKLSMQNILQQAGEAMMSQANQNPQSVLSLLQ